MDILSNVIAHPNFLVLFFPHLFVLRGEVKLGGDESEFSCTMFRLASVPLAFVSEYVV